MENVILVVTNENRKVAATVRIFNIPRKIYRLTGSHSKIWDKPKALTDEEETLIIWIELNKQYKTNRIKKYIRQTRFHDALQNEQNEHDFHLKNIIVFLHDDEDCQCRVNFYKPSSTHALGLNIQIQKNVQFSADFRISGPANNNWTILKFLCERGVRTMQRHFKIGKTSGILWEGWRL